MPIHTRIVAGILAVVCLLTALPLAAQAVPTSPPSASSLVAELSNAVEANGTFAAVLMGVVVIMAGVVIFLIMSVRVGLKPLLDANTNASNRAKDAQEAMIDMQERVLKWQEEQYRREAEVARTRQLQAEALERTVTLMANVETRGEAELARASAVQSINSHTDTIVQSLQQSVERACQDVQAIQDALQDKVSQTDLNNGLQPVLERLTTIVSNLDEIRRLLVPITPTGAEAAPADKTGQQRGDD